MTGDPVGQDPDHRQVVLDPVEQRILGALLEKQRTVPASYPLTANALRTACNQSTSRDPVVDYDDRTILEAITRLRQRELVRSVWAGSGSRVLKYHQRLEEHLGLDPAQAAVVTLLLLRGPQTPGELRPRSERLYQFADRDQVESTLSSLAATGVAHELARQPGRHERRWMHALGDAPPVNDPEPADTTPPDRESVLAAGAADRDSRVVAAYDGLAAAYAQTLIDELDGRPFDRWLLERLAGHAEGGPIVDAGCGPGQVAAYLASCAPDSAVTGFDLSTQMLAQGRTHYPQVDFITGGLAVPPMPRGADPRRPGWAVLVAWYSLVHLAESELTPIVAALARSVRSDGWLGLALHAGAGVHHVDELFGEPTDLEFVLHDPAEVLAAVQAAGLVDVEWYLRGPLPGEAATERCYVIARRP